MPPQEKITSAPLPCLSGGPLDDDALQAFRQMAYTYLKLQRRVEEMLVPYGLALSQFEALAKVGMNPGVIQQELVKYLLVTKGNVGRPRRSPGGSRASSSGGRTRTTGGPTGCASPRQAHPW